MATTDDLALVWSKRREFIGANHPGLRLNNLTTTERDALTGAGAPKAGDTAFNTTAGRAETYNGSAWQNMLRRPVVEDGTSVTLTAADCGALCIFDKVDGALFTLPAPAIGLWFEFIVVASVTSNSMKVITNTGTVLLVGSVDMVDTDTSFTHTNQDANGTNHVSVTMASASTNSTGGIKGTRFVLTCRSATSWTIHGQIHHAGSVASPFATS